MNLNDCWGQLSEHVRNRVNSHHPNATLDDSATPLTEPKYWESYTRRLSADERVVLNWLAVERGEDWLSFRELQGIELPLHPVPFRIALTRLRQRGVVYAVRQPWGETCYVLPADVREAWLATVLADDCTPTVEAEVTHLAPPGIVHDLFHFLTMIERDGVALTGQGHIHQRSVQKMNTELATMEESFADADWITGDGDMITSVHIVHRLAQQCGLIENRADQRLSLNREGLSTWLKQTHEEAARSLYCHVRSQLLRERPRDAAVLWWMEQQAGWVSVRDMALYWVQQQTESGYNWETFADEWTKTCLEPFHGLGWIDWGEGASGTVWRWSGFSPFVGLSEAVQSQGYVQPNFEWLIPLYFPLSLRWKASQFADLVQTDQMCTYDINSVSVKRGLEKGWTAKAIIGFLTEHSVTPVPQNVEASIRQWENQLGSVRLERVILLTCQDKQVARALHNHSDIDSCLRRRLGDTDFVVDEAEAERLISLLREQEYSIVASDRWHVSSASDHRAKPKRSHKRPQVEKRYPELEEAVPGLASLPKLWTSSMREYHPSTLRQLVQRALDMQLELEWRSGKPDGLETLRPTRLISKDGEWQVEGVDGQERLRKVQLSKMGQVRIRIPTFVM